MKMTNREQESWFLFLAWLARLNGQPRTLGQTDNRSIPNDHVSKWSQFDLRPLASKSLFLQISFFSFSLPSLANYQNGILIEIVMLMVGQAQLLKISHNLTCSNIEMKPEKLVTTQETSFGVFQVCYRFAETKLFAFCQINIGFKTWPGIWGAVRGQGLLVTYESHQIFSILFGGF